MLLLSCVSYLSPHQHGNNFTNHPLNIWECLLPQMMETSVPDTTAIPYGNLEASCFPNQLAKNIIPYADLCTTHPHFVRSLKNSNLFQQKQNSLTLSKTDEI